jgi:hypothetical protein
MQERHPVVPPALIPVAHAVARAGPGARPSPGCARRPSRPGRPNAPAILPGRTSARTAASARKFALARGRSVKNSRTSARPFPGCRIHQDGQAVRRAGVLDQEVPGPCWHTDVGDAGRGPMLAGRRRLPLRVAVAGGGGGAWVRDRGGPARGRGGAVGVARPAAGKRPPAVGAGLRAGRDGSPGPPGAARPFDPGGFRVLSGR